MPWLIVVLRLVHIVSGVFWAGAVFVFVGFVEPTASARGAEGSRFLQALAGKSGYSQSLMGAGIMTVVAGLALLWLDSGGFQPAWMASGMGITLSVGMLAGIMAAVVGIGLGARNAMRLGKVAGVVQARGGAPTPEEAAGMDALQGRLRNGARLTAAFLAVAVAAMAVARYAAV
jgi:hypothetical protein